MWIDITDGGPGPRRGDWLRSSKTLYYVLHSRKIKRRDPEAQPRYELLTIKDSEIDSRLRAMLNASAARRGGRQCFDFTWYPRTKKVRTFEQYMNRKAV
jgi:hypothetical protein